MRIDPGEASYTLDAAAEFLDHVYVKPARRRRMGERLSEKSRRETRSVGETSGIVVGPRPVAPMTDSPAYKDDDIPF